MQSFVNPHFVHGSTGAFDFEAQRNVACVRT
jgi:hypothetical protein